jgi:hypothetical protein
VNNKKSRRQESAEALFCSSDSSDSSLCPSLAFFRLVRRHKQLAHRVAQCLAIWSGQAIPTLPRARRVTTMWSWRALSAVRAPNSCLRGCQARRVCVCATCVGVGV